MIRLNKQFFYLFFILILFGLTPLKSQNLFDLEHSRQFAEYLKQTKQFELAVQELERIVFLEGKDSESRLELIKNYRHAGLYEKGLSRLYQMHSCPPEELPPPFSREYLKFNFLTGNYMANEDFLNNSNKLNQNEKTYYTLSNLLLQTQWEKARSFAQANKNTKHLSYQSLLEISQDTKDIHYKSPALALGFSAVLPGSGKAYSKRWADGIISLLFIGSNAFQSYQGFKKDGIKSATGWIFGTISLGFYGGNLYGSYKAAKIFNQKLDHEFYHKAQTYIYSDF